MQSEEQFLKPNTPDPAFGMHKQTIKDLSYALFMGASLDAKYKNVIVAERNKKVCEFFSRPIAQVNKNFFKTKIHEKLPHDH